MDKLLLGLMLLAIVIFLWYVSLIKKRNTVLDALSLTDQQLAKRFILIPPLLEKLERMEPLRAPFIRIAELCNQLQQSYCQTNPSAVQTRLAQVEQFNGAMTNLMHTLEVSSRLKSDAAVLDALQTFHGGEASFLAARRFYNLSVAELNTAIEIFPGSIIAAIAQIKIMPFYEADQSHVEPALAKLAKVLHGNETSVE